MRLNTHLSFNGQCREAFEYYEKHLSGKIKFMMTYGDSPMAGKVPSDLDPKIMHASLELGSDILTGSDAFHDSYQKPQGFGVLFSVNDAAEADRIFQDLSKDAVIQMPIQETFWALRFGMLIDRFGTPWMINCEKPMS